MKYATILLMALTTHIVSAGNDLNADPNLKIETLSNGMVVAVYKNSEPPNRMSMRLLVRRGSACESESERGLAHFIEHMAFNGTKNFPSGDMVEYFQRLGMAFGADTNAHTGFTETVYKLDMPDVSEKLANDGLRLLRDYADGILFDPEAIERERGVIIAEKDSRDDQEYRKIVKELEHYFSEYALIKYRVRVEIEYFIALCEIPLEQLESFDSKNFEKLRDIYRNFSIEDAVGIKEIEKTTNHDVKAVEYFIKGRFKELGIERFGEFVHFGLTSQDINNTSIPLSLCEGINRSYMPQLDKVVEKLEEYAQQWKDVPMLAHTHGQPASPTRLGKEIMVFAVRIREQLKQLEQIPHSAKFGGATGNMNAHYFTYPQIDWHSFADRFVSEKLHLKRSFPTTQIEHYDNIAALFDCLKRINTILIDLSRDIWTYISMEYFRQKIKAGEVGSSAMPHKVNPIDFENAKRPHGFNGSEKHRSSRRTLHHSL